MATYKVIFKGELCETSDREKINGILAKLFKIPISKSSQLFNGKAYSLKKELNVDEAIALQQKLLAIGVITRLIKEQALANDITYQQTEQQSQHEESGNNKTNTTNDNDQTELTPWWKKRFALIEKLENQDYEPSFKEKFLAQFNPLALVIGIIYYFIKGMWTKGILLWFGLTVYLILLMVIEETGVFVKEFFYVVPPLIVPMLLVNRDYYLFKTKGEVAWDFIPPILIKPIFKSLMALFCGILLALNIAISMLPTDIYDGVWRGNKDGSIIKIELSAIEPSITVNGLNFPVLEITTDDTDLATLEVQLADGSTVNWKLITIEGNGEGDYGIAMQVHSGQQDRLTFIKGIY